MSEDIVHIEINDWNIDEESKGIQRLYKILDKNSKELIPGLNYILTCYDLALVYLVTTTRKWLKEHSIEDYKHNCLEDGAYALFSVKIYPEYNPDAEQACSKAEFDAKKAIYQSKEEWLNFKKKANV